MTPLKSALLAQALIDRFGLAPFGWTAALRRY
jgi:hypothetical protein